MTKRSLIPLSILLFLIVLIGILFGTVFCLRTQNVTVVGDSPIAISKEEIIKTANFKKGKSIFMLNKDMAINNIEKTYPYIKVIQIKTTSVTKIDIIVRARHEMFYTSFNESFYVFDEELKLLKIVAPIDNNPAVEPVNLIHIEDSVLNIATTSKVGEFIGTDYQRRVTYNLYNSVICNVNKKDSETTEYYTRSDVLELFNELEFETYNSFDKIIISTEYGVKFDIENPMQDLTYKMNLCLTIVKQFVSDAEDKEKSGTIKIYYDLNDVQRCVYIPANPASD